MSRKKTSIFIHNDDETEPLLEGSHHNVTTAPGDETEGELTDGGEISDVGYIGDTDNESAKKKRKKTKNVKKKKKKKRCPKYLRMFGKYLKKVWLSDNNQYTAIKSALTFPIGILLGYAFNQVVLTKFDLEEETFELTSAGCLFVISVCFTASVRMRCILSLVVLLIFGRGGRSYVSAFAIMFLISGPVTNIIYNAKETTKMLTCMTQLLVNLTANKFKLRTEPIKEGLKDIQSRGFYIKEIIQNLHNSYRPIKDEIEDDSEVVEIKDEPPQKEEVIYNPKAKEERVPMEEREEAGYEEQSHLSRVLDIERRWQRKLNYRCEGVFHKATERCRRWFAHTENQCMSAFSIFGYILCLPLKLSILCNVIRIFTGVLGLDCNSVSIMNPGMGETYTAVHDMVDGLDNNFKVNMQYKIVNSEQDLNYMTAEHARKSTMRAFEEKARIMKFVMTVMKRMLAFTFLIVLRNAFTYHKKWVSDFRFDNIYITTYFRHIDARRQAQGKRTLLPLKKIEETMLIYPWKPSMMAMEKRTFVSSSLLLMFRVFISGLLVFMDYLLYFVLDLINRHSRVDYQQKGEHKIKFTVYGTGYLQYVVRLFLESFNKHYRLERSNTNVDCLPDPLPLSMYELSVIFSIYFVIWVMLYVEAYALRMRRIISSFYYRKLEKRRVLYLYNDLLKKRVGLLRHMRKKVRKLAKEKKLSEKTSILYALKQDFPRLCGWLRVFQSSKTFCLICKTPEIPGNFHNCLTPGCNFGYCRQCWKDVKRKCYACLESFNDDSDVTSESDLTDDDDMLD